MEIIETFTVDYAKSKAATSGESASESWRVFTSALVAPSPAPARVAAVCRATPDFVDSLPAARRGELDCRVPSAVEEAPSLVLRWH